VVTGPILHLDVDAFFAAVEVRDDPGLAGLPLAVGEGVVACASYEAREWGVHAGMTVPRAHQTCPRLVTTPPRPAAYQQASKELFALVEARAEAVQPGSVEEAFVRLPGLTWAGAEGTARELRRTVRAELGLPVSIGVGRTKLIAKLASRAAKPGGVVVIDLADEPAVRNALRVDELWGIGPVTRDRLTDAGLHTVADLRGWTMAQLVEIAGTAMGRRLHQIATATDDADVRPLPPRRSFSVQRTTPTRTRDLAAELARRLRAEHLTCRTLHVRLGDRRAKARFDPPTDDPVRLAEAAVRLAGDHRTTARLMVTDLRPADRPAQPPLPGL
jgi:DNA polymerase-4